MSEYFIFKGIKSSDLGIIVTAVPPIIKPEKRVNQIKIPGCNGVLHQDEGTYSNYTKDVECAIKNRNRKIDYSFLDEWLDGYGELIFSSEPNVVYRAMANNQISVSGVIKSFAKFLIQFDVQPFKYSVNKDNDFLTLTESTTIYNKGTYYSEPIITVCGTGDITLTINDIDYSLNSIDGYVTINSEIQEVYKDNTNKNNTFMADDFPYLKVGANSISFAGNVTKIEIIPNWRYL